MERSDDILVGEAQDGQLQAFDQLMVRYQKLVCKIAIGYVKDRESALDVTQNVFTKVYQHLDRVRADGMFKPWLLRITYNESISFLRKRRPQEVDAEGVDYDPAFAEDAEQEERMVKQETEGQILKGIEKLNPKYKMAVSLRYAEGMRVREIADVMGCSEGMVKSLLFRGVRQIRKHVAGAPSA